MLKKQFTDTLGWVWGVISVCVREPSMRWCCCCAFSSFR